jgi:hypothetical protein
MIINESLNYNESVQFFLSMRKTVCNVIENSSKLTKIEKSNLENFLINEASDYEILHLAMKGDLPKQKFNINEEFFLLSELKEKVLINYNSISEFLSKQDLDIFLAEVGPLYPEFTTAKPVMEHYIELREANASDLFKQFVQKYDDYMKGARKLDAAAAKNVDTMHGGGDTEGLAPGVEDWLKRAWQHDKNLAQDVYSKIKSEYPEKASRLQNLWSDIKQTASDVSNKAVDVINKGRERSAARFGTEGNPRETTRFKDLKVGSEEQHAGAKKILDREKQIDDAKEALKNKGQEAVDKVRSTYHKAKNALTGEETEPGVRTKGLIDDAKEKGEELYNKGKEIAGSVGKDAVKKGEELYHKGKEIAGDVGKQAVDKAHAYATKLNDVTGGHGTTALAATALAGMAVYGASKIYKRFFSQAARACAGKSGAAKDVCMKQFKAKATQARMQSLVKSKATCKKAKNPQKCIAAIDAEIQKIKK